MASALDAATSMKSLAVGVRCAVSEKVPARMSFTFCTASFGWAIIFPISPFLPWASLPLASSDYDVVVEGSPPD